MHKKGDTIKSNKKLVEYFIETEHWLFVVQLFHIHNHTDLSILGSKIIIFSTYSKIVFALVKYK